MASLIDYAEVAGAEVIDQLLKLARPLRGRRIVHVNSTRAGGGVAEILAWMIPLMQELGLDAAWEVITGDAEFFQTTKNLHTALQGVRVDLTPRQLRHYAEVNAANAQVLGAALRDADFVFIHDPQPAALIESVGPRRGRWIWRCHIDVSQPARSVWKALREHVRGYDASIFSLPAFAQPLPHPQYIVPPSIDPLSPKNQALPNDVVGEVAQRYSLDPQRPVVLQVSRFDRFKDPLGVIAAFRMARLHVPIQLVLAGGGASDDPEGEMVLDQVRDASEADPDIHVLLLPPGAHHEINALQRRADVVLQKSLREGFGLTVTEALWKEKPVVGGETGGIMLQVINHHTGFRVSTAEGAAFRIRYLLNHPAESAAMGTRGRRFVRDNFLLTRQLRDYLTVMLVLQEHAGDRLELSTVR